MPDHWLEVPIPTGVEALVAALKPGVPAAAAAVIDTDRVIAVDLDNLDAGDVSALIAAFRHAGDALTEIADGLDCATSPDARDARSAGAYEED